MRGLSGSEFENEDRTLTTIVGRVRDVMEFERALA
jgi:hypothetical protein